MVELILEKDWVTDGARYGKAYRDKNTYTTGVIAGHNIVLAYMPSTGSNKAAAVVNQLQMSFTGVEIIFVVGVCGAAPIHPVTGEEVVQGDCIISRTIIQYDFGRSGPGGFERKSDLESFVGTSPMIQGLLAKWSTRKNRQQLTNRLTQHLDILTKNNTLIQYPGIERDLLFHPSYIHTHRSTSETCDDCSEALGLCNKNCDTLGCDTESLITRTRTFGIKPRIHFGRFGSANIVLKSGLYRDTLSKKDQIVGFEMEASGVWEAMPTIVIKSVSNYADSHKNKVWQEYAAASAAAGLKAVLEKLELQDVSYIANLESPFRTLQSQHGSSQDWGRRGSTVGSEA